MNPFTEKNQARREGKATTPPAAYREARTLRRGVAGAFGKRPPEFQERAAVGTRGAGR